jgi:hypothetical protein
MEPVRVYSEVDVGKADLLLRCRAPDETAYCLHGDVYFTGTDAVPHYMHPKEKPRDPRRRVR